MSNSRVKIGFLTIIIVALCATAIFTLTFLNAQTRAFAAESTEMGKLSLSEQYDAEIKQYDRRANIYDNFEDDKVIVILKNKYSNIRNIGLDSFLDVSRKIDFASIGDSLSVAENRQKAKIQYKNTNYD